MVKVYFPNLPFYSLHLLHLDNQLIQLAPTYNYFINKINNNQLGTKIDNAYF